MFITNGEKDQVIPGDIASLSGDENLRGLSNLGEEFANKYKKITCTSPILSTLWLVDTPRLDQYYSPVETKAIRWFAKVAWKIILIFDSTKLRFGEETRENLAKLFKYRDKFQIVLNKSQKVKEESLFRQHGNLIMNMHNTWKHQDYDLNLKYYVTSFTGYDQNFDLRRPLSYMFTKHSNELLELLWTSTRVGVDTKIAMISRRARQVIWHADLMMLLRNKMPRYNPKKPKRDWETKVMNLVAHSVTQLKQTDETFALRTEKYAEFLMEERFKFSKDRKKVEKLELVIKAGIPLLRKELYRNKTIVEVEKKLLRLGLINSNGKMTKEQLKNTQNPTKHLIRKVSRSRAMSGDSAVSPVSQQGSLAHHAFGGFSVVSDLSYQREMQPSRRQVRRKKPYKAQQHQPVDTFSVASSEMHSQYRRKKSSNRKKPKGATQALMLNVTLSDSNTDLDAIDAFSAVSDEEFGGQNNHASKRNLVQLKKAKSNRRISRRATNMRSTENYNVCRAFSKFGGYVRDSTRKFKSDNNTLDNTL